MDSTDGGARYFSPLRYPGGKAKLFPFVKSLIAANGLLGGEYVEPYAGGAGIGIELLAKGYVSRLHINDINRPLVAFWKATLTQTERFIRKVHDTRLTLRTWDMQKAIFVRPEEHDEVALGFAMFFLNRTSRSGILNGGVIGGRNQAGRWKIDARYDHRALAIRIATIARMADQIEVTGVDAIKFLRGRLRSLPSRTLIYLDPPYYVKGKDLYDDFYEAQDHAAIATFLTKRVRRQKWMISYDNVKPIRDLYAGHPGIAYGLGYSARDARGGSEVMYFAPGLRVPQLSGGMVVRPGATRNVPRVRPVRFG
ncbi:MAG TPA: DNA adenine methylase [Polyangia bacterium]|jgi:DNA adenine methylase|nr:DNA adenine methylase [Polyangia bacterium]